MNKNHQALTKAVIKQLGGIEELEEFARHLDASAGCPGFVYYDDTVSFAHKNQKLILRLLDEVSDSLGTDSYELVCSFGVFMPNGPSKDDRKDIHRYLAHTKCLEVKVPNVMAWFALEEVAKMHDSF